MTDARCIGVFGMRGTGKTTLIQELIAPAPAAIALDPLGQYHREHRWPMARSIAELHRMLTPVWSRGFKIAFTPEGDEIEELHKLSVYLWIAQIGFERRQHHRMLTLVVEEMDLSYPSRPLPSELGGFKKLILQGRHRGVEIVGVSQAPSLVGATFRRNVAETYVFRLGLKDDRRLWPEHDRTIETLPVGGFLRFNQAGAARGETRPLKRR